MRRSLRRFVQLTVPAFLVVLLVASSLTHASATIVTVATDSAVGKNSLAMPGSQDILKDAFGKYLAVYVDAGGSVSVVYANSDPTQAGAWSPPSKSPTPVAAYRRPAAVFTSPLTMRIIAEGGPAAADLVDIPVSLSRDLTGNIASISFGSPTVLSTSAQYPSAIPTHDGGIIITWNSVVVGVSSTVFSLRWTLVTGWTSVSNPFSGVPDTVIQDKTNANNIQANVIERPDNLALLVVGNRGERSNDTTLVFNAASYNGIGWAWGTQNLAYETDASRGLSDATDLAWDPVRSVVVVTYDISRTSRYGIIQIDAAGSKVHVDTPDLKLTNNEWGGLEVDPSTGDYVLFTMDTPPGPAVGPGIRQRDVHAPIERGVVRDADPDRRGNRQHGDLAAPSRARDRRRQCPRDHLLERQDDAGHHQFRAVEPLKDVERQVGWVWVRPDPNCFVSKMDFARGWFGSQGSASIPI